MSTVAAGTAGGMGSGRFLPEIGPSGDRGEAGRGEGFEVGGKGRVRGCASLTDRLGGAAAGITG